MYGKYLKRGIDLVLSMLLIVILSPVYLTFIVLLIVQNRGTPFFIQSRPGYQEQNIQIIKFKTMTDETDNYGNPLSDIQRITPVGRFARKFSIDELPQLFNVFKGDMSLVGPRPLLFKYIPLYNMEQRRRHEVKPGITGLAQVNGRNSLSWSEKFNYDIYYVDNLSFLLDLKILFLTVIKVLKREGINQSELRPMQPFRGNNS